jgi:hypothetical protein
MSGVDPASAERQRRVEILLGRMGVMMAILDHDTLRVNQAIRRTGLTDLLSPVIDDHHQIRKNLEALQQELSEIWTSGQAAKWK